MRRARVVVQAPETGCVGGHRPRRAGDARRNDQGRDQAERGERHGDQVVAERQAQVLPDQPVGPAGDVQEFDGRSQLLARNAVAAAAGPLCPRRAGP